MLVENCSYAVFVIEIEFWNINLSRNIVFVPQIGLKSPLKYHVGVAKLFYLSVLFFNLIQYHSFLSRIYGVGTTMNIEDLNRLIFSQPQMTKLLEDRLSVSFCFRL